MIEKTVERYTIAEYLAMEKDSLIKHEYHRGEILAMSGGTINHGLLGGNIISELNRAIRDKGSSCFVMSSDVKLYIDKLQSFVYPDSMVICGDIEETDKESQAVVNPVLIVEVLSNSTAAYDRGDKFHMYCSLPSFKEYVLIDQDKPVIDVLYRADATYWRMTTCIGLEESLYLHTLDCHIPMRDIYRGARDLGEPTFAAEQPR